ncbi:uncharacterized protein FTJAE_265 [Fusarium tjaetaba]|uniref:Uncharacterized protein n=1 Tax=Fusarium tjaetaba TaxID=1567544 RepID=A0A8H5SGB2_9HYPO|nr:uncharacterized protein FTJAE_265 [Fusarium tjaetaba]KAF5651088.1 hypothetical protein FTJAE_265 [Fusarium tjaetaba]
MDDDTQDWAFSDSGLAYNTGKPGRDKFKIIRVKPTSEKSLSSKAKVSFANMDTELTKTDFTEQENDWDIKTTPTTELVLLVGECMAERDDELLSAEYRNNTPRTMNVASFDSKRHAYLNTRDSGLIVRLLGDNAERRRFFTLEDRQDGLCNLRPLASVKTNGAYKKVYWYSEFFVGDRQTRREDQAANIKRTIAKYVSDTIENLDVPVRPRASQLSEDERTCSSIDPASSLQSLCMSAMAMYEETGSIDDLEGLFTASQIARGSSDPCAVLDEKKHYLWECIRQLGQGDMTRRGARRLLEAYKLWPHAINSVAERILTTDSIVQLNDGLCMGALWHLTEVLPDALYRPLIFQFCETASRMTFDDDRSLQAAILDAYEMTEGMMGSPFPTVHKVLPLSAETTLYLASARVSYDDLILKSLDKTIQSLHLDCPTNEQDTPIDSATLIATLAETSDVHLASELVKLKIQADAMKMVAPLRSWRKYISKDKDIHAAIVNKFTKESSGTI